MELTCRKCTPDDLEALRALSRTTFDTAFRHLNTPENMAAYLDSAFDMDNLRAQLHNTDSEFYFMYADAILAGYIKLNEHPAQTDLHDPASLELERIYVMAEFRSTGIGSVLMDKAVEIAKSRGKDYVWLGVWEQNEKAIRFYKSHGFSVFSGHTFLLGDDPQQDLLLRKDLQPGK